MIYWDLAKIEADELTLNSTPINIEDIANNIRTVFEIQAREKNLSLQFHLPPREELNFLGDRPRMNQILTNLMANAFKFTQIGFVSVVIRTEKANEICRNLAIEMTDSGIGMDSESIQRIFNKFVQADDSIVTQFGGTGLGLAISLQLAEKMGGTINVQAERLWEANSLSSCLSKSKFQMAPSKQMLNDRQPEN